MRGVRPDRVAKEGAGGRGCDRASVERGSVPARRDADDARAETVVAEQGVALLVEQRRKPPRHIAVTNQDEIEHSRS